MVLKFRYHPHFWRWYLNLSVLSLLTMVPKFRYHPHFWRWYLNLGTILLSTMVLKSQYLPMCKDGTEISVPSVLYVILSQHLSYQVIATIATSRDNRLFRTASSSRCHAAWSALTVRYNGLAVLPIPDLFIFAIAYVYTFFTQYMRSIAMQIVV